MKRLLLALAIVFGLGSYPTQAQNCYTVNGVQTCASSLRLFDSTARSASQPVLDLTQGWLNPAVTFTGLRLNVTDSGSASGSLLFDMQVGGTSKFSVDKSGNVIGVGTVAGSAFKGAGTVAVTGDLRLANLGVLAFRNAANSADVNALSTNASDVIVLCGANCGGVIPGTNNVRDIGAAATSWRTGYFGTSINVTAGLTLKASADKLTQVNDNANATGLELNVGTPTLGTCTGGTLVSGSHNFGGEITGNTSGSCVLNFGTPSFTNTPFCFVNDETTLTAVRISARSASSITITGAVSADAFQYFCIGRIGT